MLQSDFYEIVLFRLFALGRIVFDLQSGNVTGGSSLVVRAGSQSDDHGMEQCEGGS
jgi:hypothetical protein